MYLIDTSAILAHCLDEEGWDQVDFLLFERETYVAAITWFELRVGLKNTPDTNEIVRGYEKLVTGTIDLTHEIAVAAFELRQVSGIRIPTVDAVIAASAKVLGYELVHRDPHLGIIPARLLKQRMLPAKAK